MRYIYRYGFIHFRWGPRLESSLGGMQSMIAVTTTGSLKVKLRVSHRWRRPTQALSPSGASPATVSSRVYHLPYHPPRGYHPVVQRSGRPTALYSNNPASTVTCCAAEDGALNAGFGYNQSSIRSQNAGRLCESLGRLMPILEGIECNLKSEKTLSIQASLQSTMLRFPPPAHRWFCSTAVQTGGRVSITSSPT